MCDCLMQEQIWLRQQVGSLTASLHAAEQAQGNAEVAAQEERQRHAEAAQVNRLTLFPFPFPFPFLPPLPPPSSFPSQVLKHTHPTITSNS